MAKTLPGGSSVTRKFPASLGPTAAPDLWTVTYEVDWTTVAPDWKDSTPHTVAGVSWGQGNEGSSSLLEANSNGLQITPNADGKFKNGQVDAPRIAARLELLCPGWDALDTVCIQILGTASATLSNDDEFGFALSTAANPNTAGSMLYTLSHTYSSGVKDSLYGAYINSSFSADYASTSGGSLLELTLFPGDGVSALSSGSVFVDPLTATGGYKAFGTMANLRAIGPANALSLEPGNTGNTDAYVQLYAARGSSGSGYTATITSMRVLKKKRSL